MTGNWDRFHFIIMKVLNALSELCTLSLFSLAVKTTPVPLTVTGKRTWITAPLSYSLMRLPSRPMTTIGQEGRQPITMRCHYKAECYTFPSPCFLCGLQLNTTGQGQHVTFSSVQIVAPDISWWHFLAGRCCHPLRGESLDKQVSEDSTDTHWTQWLTNWSQWTHWEGGESPPISLVNVKRSIWWTSRTPHYGLNGWRIWSFMLRKWLWLPCLNQQCMVLDLQ